MIKPNLASIAVVMALALFAFGTEAGAQSPYYTDTGSPANPDWATILPTLNVGSGHPGPVYGSVIDVNNTLTETGLYGNRPISVGAYRIYVCCNTSTTNFANFTRWYQVDGNTQVLRLFVNDEGTATSRTGSARTEAFTTDYWNAGSNKTYEWTGRYTVARRQQGYAIFQVKNPDHDWAVQLNLLGSGELVINNRRNAVDVTITNQDGSTKDFDGQSFDARIQDDGRNYKVWIDGVLLADNYFDRPTADSNFRWGMYLGDATLVAPSDNTVILVSGAQSKSWTGTLTAATTSIVKANNTTNLAATTSWTGAAVPGLHNLAVWDSTVTAANAVTLNGDHIWAGLKITNPGGAVTLNGTSLLGLDESGLDMSTTTRNLTMNCPVELRVTQPWTIATGFTATSTAGVRGYGGLTLSGGGTLTLTGTNTFTGPTAINAGVFRLGNGATNGTMSPKSTITIAAGAVFQVNSNSDLLQGTDFSTAALTGGGGLTKAGTGTLTLNTANTFTGPTVIQAGTLRLGNGGAAGALSASSPISIAAGATFETNRTLDATQGAQFSSDPITGGGSLVKSSTGKLTLVAANSYTGGTIINSGTLQVGTNGATGTLGTGNVTNNGTLRFDRTGSIEVADSISGTGAITVDCPLEAGTVILSGNNSFSGAVTINSGALRVTQSSSLGSGTKSVKINTGTTGNPQLLLDGSGGAINLSASISYLTSNDANGAIISEAGNNTIAGPITMTGGGGNTRVYSNAGTLTLSGPIDSNFTARTLKLMGAGNGSVTGVIRNGNPSLIVSVSKEEGGTWTLGGDNSYSGTTSILAGTLVLAHPNALGIGAVALGNATGGTTLTAGAALDLNGQQGINEVISLRGSGPSGDGAMINNSPVEASIAGGRVSSISTTASGTHSTVPTVNLTGGGGSGATAVASLGVRTASFTINGGTTVYSTAPTVTISGGGGAGATATAVLTSGVVTGITVTAAGNGFTSLPVITFSGGTVTTAGVNPTGVCNGTNFAVIGIQVTNPGSGYTSAPTVSFGSGSGTTATANMSSIALGADTTLGGSGDTAIQCGISGAFALTKSGSGKVTLSGPCTHSGGTFIAAGTLALGASNVLPANAIAIGAATLDAGVFTDAVGSLDVTAAAAIRLGTGATLSFADSSAIDWSGGTLNLTGTFVSGASLRFGSNASGLTSTQLAKISAAGFTSFALDANGYLTASVAASFANWQTSNGISGSFDADHDQDGVPNGIEYFLGGSSNTSGPTTLPAIAHTSGTLSITWSKASTHPGLYGTDFTLETSTSLTSTWTPEVLGVNVTRNGNQFTYTFPVGGTQRFVRLRVVSP